MKLVQASVADEGDGTRDRGQGAMYAGTPTGSIDVGPTGLTLDISGVATNGPMWRIPFRPMDNNSTKSGWVTIVGPGKGLCLYEDRQDCTMAGFKTDESRVLLGRRTLQNQTAVQTWGTTFQIGGTGAIGSRGWFDTVVHTSVVKKLVFGTSGTLEVGHSANAARTPSLLVANAFTPPTERLNVKTFKTVSGKVTNEEEAPFGTYEILKFPRTVALDPSLCRYSGSVRGLSVEFSVVDDGTTWKTLKMDVMKRGAILIFR